GGGQWAVGVGVAACISGQSSLLARGRAAAQLPAELDARAGDPARRIRSVCVYCGSAGAVDERYRAAAAELGRGLAAAGITMVFGGGHIGLMGIAADAALAGGGRVIGVIPAALRDRGLAHGRVGELF